MVSGKIGRTGTGERPMGSSRRLVATVGTVVVLVGAIAAANGWTPGGDSGNDAPPPSSAEDTKNLGRDDSEKAARQAAELFATQIGGREMYNEVSRHQLLQAIVVPERRTAVIADYDSSYTPAFNKRIGLSEAGEAPEGQEFVSTTTPATTTTVSYTGKKATVDVWCTGIFGIRGSGTKTPLEESRFTIRLDLVWTPKGWRMNSASTQTEGPEPEDAG